MLYEGSAQNYSTYLWMKNKSMQETNKNIQKYVSS